uniref:Uncharacterized protein n=1 Tax=Anguilla anguilla TaxID=7936 RepID=A0A0E9PTQ2_ANGAN
MRKRNVGIQLSPNALMEH